MLRRGGVAWHATDFPVTVQHVYERIFVLVQRTLRHLYFLLLFLLDFDHVQSKGNVAEPAGFGCVYSWLSARQENRRLSWKK